MLDLVEKQLMTPENNGYSCCIENTTGNILVLDVRGQGPFSIQVWALEFGGTEFQQIAVTDASNLQTLTNITSAGIYTASANAIKRVIVKPNGVANVTVYAKFGTNDANDGGNY